MKKTITLLILILSYSLSAQTWGNREYWISYEYTPKTDQISEFEKAVKEKNWHDYVYYHSLWHLIGAGIICPISIWLECYN